MKFFARFCSAFGGLVRRVCHAYGIMLSSAPRNTGLYVMYTHMIHQRARVLGVARGRKLKAD